MSAGTPRRGHLVSPKVRRRSCREYLSVNGTARVVAGGAPELLAELAETLAAPDAEFPPADAPPGYLTTNPYRQGRRCLGAARTS